MKIIYLNNRVFDVFIGEGWTNYARIRKTDNGYVILRKHIKLPIKDLLTLIETKILLGV